MAKYYIPTADEVKSARIDTKLTQQAAAELCMTQPNTWARYEQGRIQMPAPVWELFIMKVAELSVKGHAKPTARDVDAEHQAMVDLLSDWRSAEEIAQDEAYEEWRKDRIAQGILKDTTKGDRNADN
jgi:transcriptional regulator with XRE-family HTH domain